MSLSVTLLLGWIGGELGAALQLSPQKYELRLSLPRVYDRTLKHR